MPSAQDSCREHGHVRLLAGTTISGQPVYEVLPAEFVGDGIHVLHGSPGLTFGCASGDRIRVDEDGSFEVQRRSGNLCLRIYPAGVPTDSDVEPLTAAFAQLDGIVEMPANRRFIVITVPVTAGFPTVQAAVSAWTDAHSCNWDYGNVYDEHDQPLNWWIDN
jgi:hypothetical protein